MILTFRYRVKDATTGKHLASLARWVNTVWNYCGEVQEAARRHNKRRPTAFDLMKLTTGSGKLLGLHSDTVQAVCKQFVSSRDAHGKRPKWRGKKALGWVPFAAARAIKIDGDAVTYLGRRYRIWLSRPIEGKIKTGCFAADARGRWYCSLQCNVEEDTNCGSGEVGIDLGLKSLAALSTGEKIPNLRHYRKYERALGKAQRARNKKRVRAIHAKIANARRHHLHEQSTRLVRENRLIAVGNISPLDVTRDLPAGKGGRHIRKSILDASWSSFRLMLHYKASRHGARYVEVDEKDSSATCSVCGARSGPKGIAGLRMRAWDCGDCGARHDRDTNAALNHLARGRTLPSC